MTEFEFSADALCLDLANTWGNRQEETDDRLSCYGDLVQWAQQAGIVDESGGRRLQQRAIRHPSEAEEAFAMAVRLRDVVFRSCSAAATGRSPDDSDLEILNRWLARVPRRRLRRGAGCCQWEWAEEENDLRRVMWPVLRSLGELLTSTEVKRIRECQAPDCSWLFLDTSRGGRRKWCDMSVCGNRAKARRYYARHRGTTERARA
jgi:predicted RNA-binding Zn ribbon-like protein